MLQNLRLNLGIKDLQEQHVGWAVNVLHLCTVIKILRNPAQFENEQIVDLDT